MFKLYRQGDVIFYLRTNEMRILYEATEEDLVEKDLVLQHGEHGGKHMVPKRDRSKVSLVVEGRRRFLHVRAPIDVVHKEHGTIHLDKGIYEVVIQRESSKGITRQVRD